MLPKPHEGQRLTKASAVCLTNGIGIEKHLMLHDPIKLRILLKITLIPL